jgi:NitT/TauT family transport system substrate-binding protein
VKASLRLALISVVILGSTLASGGVAQSAHRALIPIKYSTSYGNFGREAYAYVALDKGYFKQAGFDVSITPGSGTIPVAQLVASGQVDYGPGDTTAAVLAIGNLGLPVKCVALIQQSTLSAYLVPKGGPIQSWKDFEGKTIGDTPGSTGTVLFPYLAKKVGIDASKVTFVPTTPQTGIQLFAAHKIDIYAQFAVGLPTVQAGIGGTPLRSFTWASVVPGLMGNCLMASDAKIANNPGQVKAFTYALLRGEKYAIDNPGDAGRILNKYVPLANPVLAAEELRIMKKYVQTPDVIAHGYGYVDPKRFDSTDSILNNFFHPKTHLTRDLVFAPGFLPAKPIKVR